METAEENATTADTKETAATRSRERIMQSLFGRLTMDGQLKMLNEIRMLLKLENRERERERQKLIDAAKARERRERMVITPEWDRDMVFLE